MLDLMPKHGSELVFGVDVGQNAPTDKDLTARKREPALEARIRIEMKTVRKSSSRVLRNPIADLLKIRINFSDFRRGGETVHGFVFRGEHGASPDFVGIGNRRRRNRSLSVSRELRCKRTQQQDKPKRSHGTPAFAVRQAPD